MLVLGIVDFCTLIIISNIAGYLTIVGGFYCSHKDLIYWAGVFALAGWTTTCCMTVLLSASRILDLWKPRISVLMFDGYKTWFWILLPFGYGFYFAAFTPPLLYSARAGFALFTNPYANISGNLEKGFVYVNLSNAINDLIMIVILPILYILFFFLLYRGFSGKTNSKEFNSLQRTLFVQSLIICIISFFASLVYGIFNIVPASLEFIVFGHFTWMLSHGSQSVIAIVFNRSLRKYIFEQLLPYKIIKVTTQVSSVKIPSKPNRTTTHNVVII
uniref:7TM_GPCR_Srx domain-containing protein n=1 Tax=Rhabditophanes sp. KR3021 TaxID=114890 RepID=A0AC35UDV3_9BILA